MTRAVYIRRVWEDSKIRDTGGTFFKNFSRVFFPGRGKFTRWQWKFTRLWWRRETNLLGEMKKVTRLLVETREKIYSAKWKKLRVGGGDAEQKNLDAQTHAEYVRGSVAYSRCLRKRSCYHIWAQLFSILRRCVSSRMKFFYSEGSLTWHINSTHR